jgi:hypothetical protein
VKRAKAVHAQKHYTAELDKEKKKRDGLQKVADTVQIEFEVGIPSFFFRPRKLNRYFSRIGFPRQSKLAKELRYYVRWELFSGNTMLLVED